MVVYNVSFESGVLNRLAQAYPEHDAWVGAVQARMVDLLDPFKAFDYYHPDQHGSASIKAVLPALTGRSYLAALGDEQRAALERLRKSIHAAAPLPAP